MTPDDFTDASGNTVRYIEAVPPPLTARQQRVVLEAARAALRTDCDRVELFVAGGHLRFRAMKIVR